MAQERAYPAGVPITSAAGRIIVSPFQFIATGEDNLRLITANSATGVRLKLSGRWFSERGTAEAFSHPHTPNTDRSILSQDYSLGAGAILNTIVFVDAGSPLFGQTFVSLQLVRGRGTSAEPLGTLLQGYVTQRAPLSWPGSPIQSSLDGEPLPRLVTGTAPAANTDWAETVPTGARWEILSVTNGFTAGVTGIARSITMAAYDGVSFFAYVNAAATHGDTLTRIYSWAPNLPASALSGSNVVQQSLPQRLILRAGWRMQTGTIGLGGGDQWGNPLLQVREWIDV